MADKESLDSDSDDEEYVPEDNLGTSEDEDYTCKVVESSLEEKQQRNRHSRKWKGGTLSHKRINKSEEEEASSEEEGGSNGGKEEKDDRREAEKKARLDDLWAGFKKETSMPNSKNTRSVTNQKERKVITSSSTIGCCPSSSEVSSGNETITIKKTYDFAGEDVVVEEKVAADSKEAQDYAKTQPKAASSQGTAGPVKRVLGAKALLQTLSKKPKMSTLEKSRLDWNAYKKNEGIEEELHFHKKDGYLEKQDFLQRTDLRLFEQERDERLKRFKQLY